MGPVMDRWTTEFYRNVGLLLKTRDVLFTERSAYQQIEIVDTVQYGRTLLLDGAVMTTERDEFVYHEMISHVPLLAHPLPRRVLIIGGGDGGTAREVLQHPQVESIAVCEIDRMVVEASRQHLPTIAAGLDDPRTQLVIGDGLDYVKHATGIDVIIVDSTDPVGPGEGLFTRSFYQDAFAALNEDGIMVAQTESPFLSTSVIEAVYPLYREIFPIVRMYTGHVPTYPSGYWTWAFCSRRHAPDIPASRLTDAARIERRCRYYNRAIHAASFVLPNFVQQLLR